MKKYYIILVLFVVVCCHNKVYSQQFDKKEFEQTIQKGIEKGYAATVKIWGIDSLTKNQNSAQFTGVVVDADGHILTAAHAILPGRFYRVVFTNGKEFTAIGLGRMAWEPKTGRPDAGMIKIVEKGSWPIAEMGWSSSLKVNEPCISIAYPTTINQLLPNIRIGRISIPLTLWGFVESTCKMEPGDSGGPLFDYMGRVIGIHSRIDVDENVNYEIPVDFYRENWTSLTVRKDYQSLPESTDKINSDPLEEEIKVYPALANLKAEFNDFESGVKENSVIIKSLIKGNTKQIFGTLFYLNTKSSIGKKKSKSFIVSKSSEVGDSINVYIAGRKIDATIISRNKDSDLLLLQLNDELKFGVKIDDLKDEVKLKQSDLGKFLISILPSRKNEISALSSGYFNIGKKFSSGYFGASANFIEQKIILTRINPGSPAEKAGLQLKDQITGINNVNIKLPPEYGAEIMKYEPEEVIIVHGIRDGSPYSIPVTLVNLPVQGNHPATRFAGGKSFRCDGFTGVFAHDGLIKAEECGGPVYDKNGKFYGINIARFSRTCTLALSSQKVLEFIKNAITI